MNLSCRILTGLISEHFSYTQSQKDLSFKVWLKPLQRLAVSKGRAGDGTQCLVQSSRRPQTAKLLSGQLFARGEFQNSPVDCFGRGEALVESVPLNRH